MSDGQPPSSPDELWQHILELAASRGHGPARARHDFEEATGLDRSWASRDVLEQYLAEYWTRTLASDDLEGAYGFALDPGGSSWVRVLGGDLEQPIMVQIANDRGRLRLTGVRIENGATITARTLRAIKPNVILEQVFGWATRELDLSDVPAHDHDDVRATWRLLAEFVQERTPSLTQPVSRRGVAPDDATLRSFAEVYSSFKKKKPHGALAAAARSVPIARSTAYRWLQLCVDRGHLTEEDR